MNSDHIIVLLGALAEQSGEKVSEFRLEFTARKLEPLGADKVCAALEKMMQTARRFPTVAEVKAEMGQSDLTIEDEARMMVDRIFKAVGQFGELPPGNQNTSGAIQRVIGDAAWDLVGRSGGWNAVVARAGENEMAARAQIRDIAAVYMRTGNIERGTLPTNPEPPSVALAEANKEKRFLLPEAPTMTGEQRLLLEAKIADLKRERAEVIAAHDRAIEVAKETLRTKSLAKQDTETF